MKKPFFHYILITVLAITTVFAFGACGDSNDGESNSEDSTTASTEVVSEYDTVVYTYEDYELEEDLYTATVTIEYDGDKVMGVTQVAVDDMTKEDDDLIEMQMNDRDGFLDDTGFKEMDGFTWDVSVNGKVRTETVHFDMTKFDLDKYKTYVGIKSDKDYISLEELTALYEDAGFKKVE